MTNEDYLRLLSGFSQFIAIIDRFDDALDQAHTFEDLALALIDYSGDASDCTRMTYRFFLEEVSKLEAWQCDVARLKGDHSPPSIWKNLVFAMEAVAEFSPQVWRYAKLSDEEIQLTSPYHAANMHHFSEMHQLATAGHPIPFDHLAQTLCWCSTRSRELARRAVIALLTAHRPSNLDEVLSTLCSR